METPKRQVIQKIREKLIEHAKQKKEYVSHFKNGGTIADFKPKYKHVSRPI